jgi:hypothetical protein
VTRSVEARRALSLPQLKALDFISRKWSRVSGRVRSQSLLALETRGLIERKAVGYWSNHPLNSEWWLWRRTRKGARVTL